MSTKLQYCNKVQYVNSGKSWGDAPPPPNLNLGGGGDKLPPASYAYMSNYMNAREHTARKPRFSNTQNLQIQYSCAGKR